MKSIRLVAVVGMVSAFFLLDSTARAAFHFMQIEQVIGGVNNDTTAQAIQLRMRQANQDVVSAARIRAWDATGANPVVLIDMTTDILNSLLGSRVLIATPNFATYTNVTLVKDFTMTPIPATYLPAGRITFENNNGSIIYWSLAWGGSGYTGSNLGDTTNDLDGNFGPPFAGVLPSSSNTALLTNLPASPVNLSRSTNNAANYGVTPGAATFTNNAGPPNGVAPTGQFVVTIPIPPDPNSADFNNDDDVDGDDFLTWQLNTGAAGTFVQGDANHDGDIDSDDLAIWETQYNTPPPLSALGAVPEPSAIALVFAGFVALNRRGVKRRS